MNDEVGTHKSFAKVSFNQTWDLIEKEDRSQAETDQMIHAAHASRYHWEFVGEAVNLAGDEVEAAKYIVLAKDAGAEIADENDRKHFFSDLKSIQPGA